MWTYLNPHDFQPKARVQILLCWKIYMRPVVAQGHKCVTRLVIGLIPTRWNEIFNIFNSSLWCRDKRGVELRHGKRERSVLILGSLCLPCWVQGTAWNWFFLWNTYNFFTFWIFFFVFIVSCLFVPNVVGPRGVPYGFWSRGEFHTNGAKTLDLLIALTWKLYFFCAAKDSRLECLISISVWHPNVISR